MFFRHALDQSVGIGDYYEKKNNWRNLQVFSAVSLTLLAVVLMLVLVTKWLRIYREQLLMELRNR